MVVQRLNRAWWALAALALLAGIGWRAAHVTNRPLHADEAVQAWQTWDLLRGHGYHYDPLDRHGPSLYYGSAALHRLTGGTANTYDDAAARRFVLLAGVATLALFTVAPRGAGFDPLVGVFAIVLLAFETLSSLYQTYFVQEAWLALWVWGWFFLLLRLAQRTPDPRPLPPVGPGPLLALGALAGLAQTTKEIAPLYLALATAGIWFAAPTRRTLRPTWRHLGWLFAGFVPPCVVLFTSFGANPGGLIDAFRTYALQAQRIGGGGHTYPWTQTLHYLGVWPRGGIAWGQSWLLIAAAIGILVALRPRAAVGPKAAALFTLGLLLLHTAIPYKTPWLLLTPVLGLGLLAAHALVLLARRGRRATFLALALAMALAGQSYSKSRLALDRYPGDPRNPYFYEQTPRAFLRLPERIATLQCTWAQPLRIAVISPENAWPLPWYLRTHVAVGFFAEADASATWLDWDVMVWDSQFGPPPAALTAPGRVVEFAGLRPNVLLTVSIAGPVWARAFPAAATSSP